MATPQERYKFRQLRTRTRIFGTPERPRLSVFRSLKHIYAQVIDDTRGLTLVSVSSHKKGDAPGANQKVAAVVGEKIAKAALGAGIKKVVFDRGARIYHGRIKAVAEAARQAGLEF
jgi:large subunit ribosomal protein L18